jgi:hypothetical protein
MQPRIALPLLLLAAWSPLALAFPPCPREPIRVDGISNPPPVPAQHRFQAWFDLIGDGAVLDALAPELRQPHGGLPGTGNCRGGEDIRLPGPHTAMPTVGLPAALGPRAGYGLIALPDPRTEPAGYAATWRYAFTVDDVPLPSPHNWVDVVALSFDWSGAVPGEVQPATVYRVRVLRPAAGPQLLQVIEIRGARETGHYENLGSEQVVATIPLHGGSGTPVALRWSQVVRSAPAGAVDTTFEVVGPGGQALYTAALPSQWANGLSVGLLNHHAPELPDGSFIQGVEFGRSELGIEGSGS